MLLGQLAGDLYGDASLEVCVALKCLLSAQHPWEDTAHKTVLCSQNLGATVLAFGSGSVLVRARRVCSLRAPPLLICPWQVHTVTAEGGAGPVDSQGHVELPGCPDWPSSRMTFFLNVEERIGKGGRVVRSASRTLWVVAAGGSGRPETSQRLLLTFFSLYPVLPKA